jgi:hypothetical protein
MAWDAGDEVSDRLESPSGDLPVGKGSRVHQFGLLESHCLSMEPSSLFFDRISDPVCPSEFSRLPPLFEMDQILSIKEGKVDGH